MPYKNPLKAKEHKRIYYQENKEKIREYLLRNREKIRKASRSGKRKKYSKRYKKTEEYKAYQREYNRKYYAENSKKVLARQAVYYAVKIGKLKKPQSCSGCCATDIEAHHEDYSKPLEVKWLCPLCHAEADRLLKEGNVAPFPFLGSVR